MSIIFGYLYIMAVIYFVVPIAFTVHVTILQAVAITFLVLMARVVFSEGITVRVSEYPIYKIIEKDEREDDEC